MKLYHCTDAGDEVARDGFWDSFLFDSHSLRGVYFAARPQQCGMYTFEVDMPDELAAAFRSSEAPDEWCVPSSIANAMPRRRLALD